VIGWGVLVLGGLGLLVAELTIVRQRTWFFGLARAVGARTGHVIALIVVDLLIVLVLGTAIAVSASIAGQPAAAAFARSAFQVDVQLLQMSTIPRLVAAVFLVLAVAGIYPAFIAVRQDVLDVLEPKAG